MLAYIHDAFDEDSCQKLNAISVGYVSMCIQKRRIQKYDHYKNLFSWPIYLVNICTRLMCNLCF